MILKIEYVLGDAPGVAPGVSSKMVTFTVTLAARKDTEPMVIARGMALPSETYFGGKYVMGFFDRLEKYKKEFEGEDVQITHIDSEPGKGCIEFDTGSKKAPEDPNTFISKVLNN
jgi:hypothetical protein